jgi:hypothetical protein
MQGRQATTFLQRGFRKMRTTEAAILILEI